MCPETDRYSGSAYAEGSSVTVTCYEHRIEIIQNNSIVFCLNVVSAVRDVISKYFKERH